MQEFSVQCKSPADTAEVATALAPLLRAGDALILKGDLAAGKTYFVQALVRALGSVAEVTSPTFTIANFYRTDAGTVLHIDAYRLSGVAEYRDLGLNDYADTSIAAVEWGDKIASEFEDALTVAFDFTPEHESHRRLTLSATDGRWASALLELRDRLGS